MSTGDGSLSLTMRPPMAELLLRVNIVMAMTMESPLNTRTLVIMKATLALPRSTLGSTDNFLAVQYITVVVCYSMSVDCYIAMKTPNYHYRVSTLCYLQIFGQNSSYSYY